MHSLYPKPHAPESRRCNTLGLPLCRWPAFTSGHGSLQPGADISFWNPPLKAVARCTHPLIIVPRMCCFQSPTSIGTSCWIQKSQSSWGEAAGICFSRFSHASLIFNPSFSDAIKRMVTMSSMFQSGTPALQQLLRHDMAVASSCLLAANLFCLPSKNTGLQHRIEAFSIGAKSIAKCPQRRLMRRYGVDSREAALELLANSLSVSNISSTQPCPTMSIE